MQKAFIVSHITIGCPGVYKAETAGKARYMAYLAAKNAGFDIRLIDLNVVRSKQYDNYQIGQSGVALEYIENYAPD